MRGMLVSAGRYRDRSGSALTDRDLAFTVAGKFHHLLLSLPVIDANTNTPVDLWTTPETAPLKELLERQPCIRRVFFSPHRPGRPAPIASIGRPIPVYGRYRHVIHLQLPERPSDYLPRLLARTHDLREPSPGFRLRLETRAKSPSDVIVLDLPPEVNERSHGPAFRQRLACSRKTFWSPPRRIATANSFDQVASWIAAAPLFIGRYSSLACIAMLAGVPTVVLCRPEEREWLRTVMPPQQQYVWQIDWRVGDELPDPSMFLKEIAHRDNTDY